MSNIPKMMALLRPSTFRKQNMEFLRNLKAFAEGGRAVNEAANA